MRPHLSHEPPESKQDFKPTTDDFQAALSKPDDVIELRPISHPTAGGWKPPNPKQQWMTPQELAAAPQVAEKLNEKASLYFGVNPRDRHGGSKNENVAVCRCLFADFDGGVTPAEAWATVKDAGLPHPTATVESGGGTHLYWRLTDLIFPGTFTARQKAIAGVLGSDPTVHDPARVMRLPGTVNRKPERNGAVCRVVEVTGDRHDLDAFPTPKPPAPKPSRKLTHRTTTDDEATRRASKYLAAMPEAVQGENGSNATYAAAAALVHGFALPEAEALEMLAAEYNPRCLPEWSDKELRHKVSDAATKPHREPRGYLLNESRPESVGSLVGQQSAAALLAGKDAPPQAKPAGPIPFGELRDAHPDLQPVVIDGLLREGETANVIAASKVGKSWLVYDLALSVITGGEWLGRYRCEPGNVLLIDNELHRQTLAHRIPKVAAARGVDLASTANTLDVLPLRGLGTTLEKLPRYIEKIEAGHYKLIVLDAWYRFIPKGLNENSNADIMGLYNTLDRYAASTEAAWVVVHHASKGAQGDKAVTDVGAGAGAQSRAADSHLVLRPHEEDGYIVLDAAVRSFAPVEPLGLRWNFPVWNQASELDVKDLKGCKSKSEQRQADRVIKAFEVVRAKLAGGPMTPKKLREATAFGKSRMDSTLEKMVAAGEVTYTDAKIRGQQTKEYRLV